MNSSGTTERQRELRRHGLSRLVIWTGPEGPVVLGPGSLGVEFRGRLGHPSSYGLLAARPLHVKADPTVGFQLQPSEAGVIDPPVRGEDVVLGLADPSYAAAIRDVVSATHVGMTVTAAASGMFGSSSVVFRRLAIVLSSLLATDWTSTDEQVIWRLWDATSADGSGA